MGDLNSKESEVNTWMKTQGLDNTICAIHGYSDAPITYRKSKDCPIDGIYCTAHITANGVGGEGGGPILWKNSGIPPEPVY